MEWFGPKPFARICLDTPKTDTPTGSQCGWCEEPIVEGDEGVILPGVPGGTVYHQPCFLRTVVGSLAHQQGVCSCHGGEGEDDPNLTKRQAAQAAVKYFEGHR